MLTGPAGTGWRTAAARLAGTGLPITALAVGIDLLPEDAAFIERYRMRPDGAVLVRPDGFVSWRHDGAAASPATELAAGVTRTLGRAAPAMSDRSAA